MKNNFNSIAKVYDTLAFFVFGNAIKDAQTSFLYHIEPTSKVLIIGGGSGWILNKMNALVTDIDVTYIEASAKMLQLAKSRAPFKNIKVRFIHGTQNDFEKSAQFDVVITNFFLDIFKRENLKSIISSLNNKLNPNGIWLITDFNKSSVYWQKTLIWLMYRFFRLTTNLEGQYLIDLHPYFTHLNFQCTHKHYFYHKMIYSSVYLKK